jgi:hypothetical protein
MAYIRIKADWQGRLVEEMVTEHGRVIVMPRRAVMQRKSRLLEPCRVLEFPSPQRTKRGRIIRG